LVEDGIKLTQKNFENEKKRIFSEQQKRVENKNNECIKFDKTFNLNVFDKISLKKWKNYVIEIKTDTKKTFDLIDIHIPNIFIKYR
jgi:hypothetical protein